MSNLKLLLQQLEELDNNSNIINNNNNNNNNTKCLITGNNIETNNIIKLNCNHTFDYISLVNEFKLQKEYKYKIFMCPYCRQNLSGFLPLHSNYGQIKGITSNAYSFLNNTPEKKCKYIINKGKNKGNYCNNNKKYYNLNYCSKHNKNTENNRCSFILIKGKNKGKECKKKCLDNNNFCKNHNK